MAAAQIIPNRAPCRGAGQRWITGTGSPICPVCYIGYRSLGLRRPVRRAGRYVGTLPAHTRPVAP